MVNWAQACATQLYRPLLQMQQANRGGNLFAVSILLCYAVAKCGGAPARTSAPRNCTVYGRSRVMQVVSFALAAVYSAMWFLRWATDRVKNRMWAQLGWFSGLVCAGCVAGSVAWAANMQNNAFFYYESKAHDISRRQRYTLQASAQRWFAAFFLLYDVEFMCLIMAKLIMLGRLSTNSSRSLQVHQPNESGGRGERASRGALARVYRVTAAAVVICSAVGMVAKAVAGAMYVLVAELADQAAAACDAQGNDTNSSLALFQQSYDMLTKAENPYAVQAILEAVALLLISTAYLILVPLSVVMFRRAERDGAHALLAVASRTSAGHQGIEAATAIVDETIQAAAEQRRRLVMACVVVLITFPARAAYDLLRAYTAFNDPTNPACGTCDRCQSDRWLVQEWLNYTPEFQPIVVALSSPLPLLVSLWIITGAHAQAYAISLSILRARLGRNKPIRPAGV